jgi:thiamine kinase-like enzyme
MVEVLPCWTGPVSPEPLGGGISNTNFTVLDGGKRYVVRIGEDHLVHRVMRFNELAIARAAHAAGLGPAIVHHQPGALVMDFIEGRTLTDEDVRDATMLPRITDLVRRCHRDVDRHLRGPALMFWVFHANRDYVATAREGECRLAGRLDDLLVLNDELEQAVGAIPVALCHNDLLAANLIDDGKRLWLLDYEHAGFNAPMFDLANLASNNQLDQDQEEALVTAYYGTAFDSHGRRVMAAMKCASLLRETLWSLVSECHSDLDFDYAAYTEENLVRFNGAYEVFKALETQ